MIVIMIGVRSSIFPVISRRMVVTATVMRVNPPRHAPAPIRAYMPGWEVPSMLSRARFPIILPTNAPIRVWGTKSP